MNGLAALLLVGLLGAVAAPALVRVAGRWAHWLLALVPAAIFAALARRLPVVEPEAETWRWVPSLGVDLALRLDGMSVLFALLISGVGALVVVYAGSYFADKPAASRARFLSLILLFMTAMLGAVLSDNLLVAFVFWEATGIISFLLVGFEHGSALSRRSALQALLVTGGGGLAFLGGIALIGAEFGSFSLSGLIARGPAVAESPAAPLIAAAILLAAFTKSAQYPFYFWLPNAMQAPTPASAYLHSATMVKLGIYLLARFEYVLAPIPGYRAVLVTAGAVTMLVAAVQALRATGFKAALAYSTVASLGIMVLLIGLDGPTATVALIGFLLAHALYKATLFFVAGTVIHATGEGGLARLGGLFRLLPVTSLAALVASLSMAGIPPFFGFVSKELLFEAQLKSSWETGPVAVAVAVNAVMVAVAGLVSLRPFFGRARHPVEARHGETVGLLLGPVVLSVLGAALSIRPDWLTEMLIAPAVHALLHERVAVTVELWHGFTPMLALSGLVVAAGGMIWWWWRPIHATLNRLRVIDRVSGDALYDRGVAAALGVAGALTRRSSALGGRGQLVVATVFLLALSGFAAWRAGVGPTLDAGGELRPTAIALLAVAVVAGFAAAAAATLIAALVSVGLAGFAVALLFVVNGAPDLAITQFSVEALLVVLLAALILPLPAAAPPTRTRSERRWDLALSAGFGAVVFVAIQGVTATPFERSLSDLVERLSMPEGFGRNVVNVILVDFRALDTLGETVVVAAAALVVWVLFRADAKPGTAARSAEPRDAEHFVLATQARFLAPLIFALSVVILLRGHNEPGGGFIGGLVAALAFGLVTLAHGPDRAGQLMRLHPLALAGLGLALTLASGIAPGRPYLDHSWATLGGLKLGTTILFDVGVYLAVLGGVTAALRRAYRESAR